jgi:hypothetical protein
VAAVRERGVRLLDRRDGTATVSLDLPLPAAAAIYRALERYAESARADGDERTKQQRMADCLQDLVLRPGEHGMPPVTVALTLVATLETMLGGAEPGQVEGMLVPAELVRELGYAFGLMPRPAPDLSVLPDDAAPVPVSEPAAEPPTAPTAAGRSPTPTPECDTEPRAHTEPRAEADADPEPTASATAPGPTPVRDRTLAEWLDVARARHDAAVRDGLTGATQAILDGRWCDGELRALLDVGALMSVRDTDGTGLAHRPHIAIVDKLRGSLVALTDAAGIRRGEALGAPPATDRYTPGAELDRFVRLRDRRCRFPGCRARARTCDLDHRQEWPDGPTAPGNLWCLCEHHHRLKHRAPGWRVDDAGDGGVAVTTPGGTRLVSHPPPVAGDLDVPPF